MLSRPPSLLLPLLVGGRALAMLSRPLWGASAAATSAQAAEAAEKPTALATRTAITAASLPPSERSPCSAGIEAASVVAWSPRATPAVTSATRAEGAARPLGASGASSAESTPLLSSAASVRSVGSTRRESTRGAPGPGRGRESGSTRRESTRGAPGPGRGRESTRGPPRPRALNSAKRRAKEAGLSGRLSPRPLLLPASPSSAMVPQGLLPAGSVLAPPGLPPSGSVPPAASGAPPPAGASGEAVSQARWGAGSSRLSRHSPSCGGGAGVNGGGGGGGGVCVSECL